MNVVKRGRGARGGTPDSTPTLRDMPTLVIFDCDGVLVDSEPLACRVTSDVLHGFGVTMSPRECHTFFTGVEVGFTRRFVEARTGSHLGADFEGTYLARLFDAYERELRPNEGVSELVSALRGAGVACCVASNGTNATTGSALEASGLADYFDRRVFTSEDVALGKPAPDLFLHAASTLGVRPDRCLVIEDSPIGIAAARAAGMAVWALVGTYPRTELWEADGVFDSLAAVSAALGFQLRDTSAAPGVARTS
jgi:HAD superfamily hydrolase (TIGR01509 family)